MVDLALLPQLGERLRGLGEGGVWIGPVHLVEVDPLDAQRLQALLDAAAQELPARVARHAAIDRPQPALGGDHHVVARVA